MQNISDSEVKQVTDEKIRELLDSDPSEGIRVLIGCYSGLVYTIAYSKLKGVFSADDIEDFVSCIFSRIYERRAEIDFSRGTLRGFIMTIARRMCIDEFRKSRSRIVTEPLTGEMAEMLPDARNTQEEAERAIDEKALTGALQSLGAKDRELLIRRYYYNQTSAQIAKEWKLSDAAVRKRLSRALDRLRALLSEEDFS